MEIFSLQIRKSGNYDTIYQDVDKILAKSQVVSGGISKEFKKQSVAYALRKMINNKNYFDVSIVREACEASGIHISTERVNLYRLAHCMNWGDMTDDYRQTLIAMIMDDFRSLFINKETEASNV